jgi:hypothetical protein
MGDAREVRVAKPARMNRPAELGNSGY